MNRKGPTAAGVAGVALALGSAAAESLNAPEEVWVVCAAVAAVLMVVAIVLFIRQWTIESAAVAFGEEVSRVASRFDTARAEATRLSEITALILEGRSLRGPLPEYGQELDAHVAAIEDWARRAGREADQATWPPPKSLGHGTFGGYRSATDDEAASYLDTRIELLVARWASIAEASEGGSPPGVG